MHYEIYFCLLLSVSQVFTQRNDQLLNDRIQNVFGTGNRGGFGEVVLPEPEDNLIPTQTPQTMMNQNDLT